MDDMQDFKKEYPGPGYHESDLKGSKYRSVSAKTFSKSNRKPLGKIKNNIDEYQTTPGPAQY